jgi:hypothetical protein
MTCSASFEWLPMVGMSCAAICAMDLPWSSGAMRAAMNCVANALLSPPKAGLVKQSASARTSCG